MSADDTVDGRFFGIYGRTVFVPRQFVGYYNLAAENGILLDSMGETIPAVIAGSGESDISIEYGGRFRALNKLHKILTDEVVGHLGRKLSSCATRVNRNLK